MSNFSNFKIDFLCRKYNIKNYIINDDGSINVTGCVNLNRLKLNKLPIRFNYVTKHFNCDYNQLTTLEGSPKWVGGDFNCSFNQLTSLKFSPERVGGYYDCSNNRLITLKWVGEMGKTFYCYNNPIPTLIMNNMKYIDIICQESEDFSIWRSDGSLDELRFKYMLEILKEEGKIT